MIDEAEGTIDFLLVVLLLLLLLLVSTATGWRVSFTLLFRCASALSTLPPSPRCGAGAADTDNGGCAFDILLLLEVDLAMIS